MFVLPPPMPLCPFPQSSRFLPSRSQRSQRQGFAPISSYSPICVPPPLIPRKPSKPLEIYLSITSLGEKTAYGIYVEDRHNLNRSGLLRDDLKKAGLQVIIETLRSVRQWWQYEGQPVILRCYGKIFGNILPYEGTVLSRFPAEISRLLNQIEMEKSHFPQATVYRVHFEPLSLVEKACLSAVAAIHGVPCAIGKVLPTTFNDRICEVTLGPAAKREISVRYEDIRTPMPNLVDSLTVFTDASYCQGKSGYGIYVDEFHELNSCGVLNGVKGINEAEIAGVQIALANILQWKKFSGQPIAIKTDNKEVLLTIAGMSKWTPLRQKLFDTIAQFKNYIFFEYIKSHAGNMGNECADFLSRKALLGAAEAYNVYCVINKQRIGQGVEAIALPRSLLDDQEIPICDDEDEFPSLIKAFNMKLSPKRTSTVSKEAQSPRRN